MFDLSPLFNTPLFNVVRTVEPLAPFGPGGPCNRKTNNTSFHFEAETEYSFLSTVVDFQSHLINRYNRFFTITIGYSLLIFLLSPFRSVISPL